MSLENTIRDQIISEAADLSGRLDQLVRAGLMPSNVLPVLHRAISKVQSGMSLQGSERDAMNMMINSLMFIVLGDDSIFNKARAGAKGYAVEETELEENAKIVAHLKKRYGDNIRKSHVMSAAKDFGVDASKLSKAVRKHLGKTMLPEAKEKQEYDYEGDMAMSQLKSIIANSQRMHDSMSEDTNLPEWVQSKITLAEDYISTAANYLQGEVSEAVGDITVKKVSPADAYKKHTGQMIQKAKVPTDPKTGKTLYQKVTSEEVEELDELSRATVGRYAQKAKSIADNEGGKDRSKGRELAGRKRWGGTMSGVKKAKVMATEESEQIDELSKATMGRYINKAKDSIDTTSWRQGHREGSQMNPSGRFEKKLSKRHKGIETAVKKLTKEESENLDELSKATMGRYINKAATKMGSQGVTAGLKIAADEKSSKQFKDMGKREKGISRAVKKLTKEDIDAVKQMNESYKIKFDAALEYYNIKSPSELGEEKRKEFFNHVDQEFKKGDN
jgi:hypothetical protein